MTTPSKSENIVDRLYTKGSERIAFIVRELSGGDIDGTMFQLEVWNNNVEDKRLRETSGDMYFIRGRYFRRLLDLLDEGGWKKMTAGVQAHKHSTDFNPEVL
jgi:hypothetical protein